MAACSTLTRRLIHVRLAAIRPRFSGQYAPLRVTPTDAACSACRDAGDMGLAKTALVASLLLVAAPSAQAGMTTPRVVSPPGLAVQEHSVAAGGGRTAIAMSGLTGSPRAAHGAVYARLGRVTTLGPSVRLSTGRGESPTVAVGADGTAVAAWTDPKAGLRVAIAAPGEPFGAVQTVRPDAPADKPSRIGGAAVTPSGRVIIAWRTGGTVQVSIAPPLHPIETTTAIGVARQYSPSISLGLGGTAVVAWLDTPQAPLPPPNTVNPGPAHVRASTLTEGSPAFSAPTDLGSVAYWPAGATTGGGPGGALVNWRGDTGFSLSRLSLSGVFSTPIDAPSSTADGKSALATDASGAAVALWRTVTYVGGDDLETVISAQTFASVAPAGGSFGPALPLSTAGWIPDTPHIAAMPDRTFAAWEERSGNHTAHIQVAIRKPYGAWRRLAPLGVPDQGDQRGMTVQVGGDAHHAPVTWISYAGVKDSSFGGRLVRSTYRP